MRNLMLLTMTAFLLQGCNSDDDPAAPENPESPLTGQEALDFNQTKWANADLSAYRFTYRTSCFCVPEEDIVVNVTDDVVTSAFYTPSGVTLDDSRLAAIRTIDGYFGLIQQGLDEGFVALDVEYDDVYGYPVNLYVDPSAGIADDEVGYQLQDLQ